MLNFLVSLFIVLHGLVHLWYVTLSQRLVTFQPEMGWSGQSWVFSNLLGDSATRALASVLYVIATIAFVVGGAGIFIRADWWRPVIVAAAVLSSATILLFWDGRMQLLVQKGLLGLLINMVILIVLLLLKWPAAAS